MTDRPSVSMKLALDERRSARDTDEALGIANIRMQAGRDLRPRNIVEDDKDVEEGMVLRHGESWH